VVPCGVDLTRFDPQRVTPQRMIQMAQTWRLPDDQAGHHAARAPTCRRRPRYCSKR
jgi:hypothetical protein